MRHYKANILIFLLLLTTHVWGINYPTYTPSYLSNSGAYQQVSYGDGQFHTLSMRSTSEYGESHFDNYNSEAFYNPFTGQYEAPSSAASGPARAPGGIGAVFARFLAQLPYEEVDGVKVYNYSAALAYWAASSSSMPAGATWEAFCSWFDSQKEILHIAWSYDDPIGDSLWLLLLLSLCYGLYRSRYSVKEKLAVFYTWMAKHVLILNNLWCGIYSDTEY